jgi:hypothetical protein
LARMRDADAPREEIDEMLRAGGRTRINLD